MMVVKSEFFSFANNMLISSRYAGFFCLTKNFKIILILYLIAQLMFNFGVFICKDTSIFYTKLIPFDKKIQFPLHIFLL